MRTLAVALSLLLLSPTAASGDTAVRVATWNVETVGGAGGLEYVATLAVLDRIAADVVGINGVLSDADVVNLEALAVDAGYPHIVVAPSGPLGSLRNAAMSRLPIIAHALHTSASLSGDPSAADLTSLIVEVEVELPDAGGSLVLVIEHWKSGAADSDEFRRAVESRRISQALSPRSPSDDAYVVMGDVNEELDSVPRTPNPFTSLPAGLPSPFVLGTDLLAELGTQGIPNDPFFLLDDLSPLPALQLDGSDATRPSSGRRLDYIFVSPVLLGPAAAEVYDSLDEGLGSGLPKSGSPLAPETSADASGHHLVFADLLVPSGPLQVPVSSGWTLPLLAAALAGVGAGALGRSRTRSDSSRLRDRVIRQGFSAIIAACRPARKTRRGRSRRSRSYPTGRGPRPRSAPSSRPRTSCPRTRRFAPS